MRPLVLAAGVASLILASIGCSSSKSPSATGGAAGSTSAGGSSTSGGSGGSAPVRPDHVVNELRQHAGAVHDDAYPEVVVTQLRTTAALADLDVRCLEWRGADLFAGTATGLFRWTDGDAAFTAVPTTGSGAVVDLGVTSDSRVLVARAGGVEVLTAADGAGAVWPVSGETIAAVAWHGADVWIGTDKGLSRLDGTAATPIAKAQGFAVRDLAVSAGTFWIATAAGVRRYDVASDAILPDLTAPAALADDDVRAVSASPDGAEVVAATANGLSRFALPGAAATLVLPGEAGLPNGDLRAVVAAASGVVATGHGIGATHLTASEKRHYHARRWIPDEQVTSVALGPDGSLWIGTHAGLSRISSKTQKLADKAALFEPMVEPLWRMNGFVDDEVSYADPYDLTTVPQHSDKDNDGLWTEMQIAAWCFAYAATGEEAYYQNARKAMDTMFLLVDVPGETFAAMGMNRGFVARSLVRDDEGALFDGKATSDRWVKQDYGGRTYYWKNDTSSDEYAGHFFGIPVFYDLCAKTEEEKQAIRDRIDLVMGYVVDGGDKLVDLDGMPTTFGRWDDLASAVDGDIGACLASGQHQNCIDSYGGGGWLNSIEILGHLLAAWHITGKDRYYDEYQRLAIDERYGDMIPLTDHTFTVTSPHTANHSDHELASLAYFTLLRYEPNPDRREKWKKSILDFYGYEKPERNALEIAVMASAMEGSGLGDAASTLRDMPSDWRQWLVDNTHRVDAALDVTDRFDDPQFEVVFPYGEIRTMKWNGNPYVVSGGGSGNSVQGPWPWLLPYWMMRYSGAIVP